MGTYKPSVNSIKKTGSTGLNGDVTLSEGTNITITQTGQDISIAATGGGAGAVDSVNAQTGVVVLDQDDILDGATYVQYAATEKTKLAGIETAADVTDATNVATAGAFMKATDDLDDISDGVTNKAYTSTEKTKLSGIATGATANDTDANLKNRANHTGTQLLATVSDVTATAAEVNVLDGATLSTAELNYVDGVTSAIQTQINGKAATVHTHTASQVTDFDTEVSNNTDVAANTTARHSHANKALLDTYTQTEANLADAVTKKHAAVTVTDSSEIDFTLTGQDITASLVAGSIDETKLDASVNASLDLADSSTQPGDNISTLTNDSGFITSAPVASVNGDTGVVVLNQDDIGDGTTYKQYSAADKTKLAGIEALADVTDATNVAAAGAFIKTVDDTDDITEGLTNKWFTAAEETKLAGIATGATANDTDANLKNRANHTGTQTASTISDFSTAADARITAATGVSVQGYSANTTTLGNTTTGTGSIVRATSPALVTPTGIVKGDVGLGNVDNTSDATKNSASATLTNKTLSTGSTIDANVTVTEVLKKVYPVGSVYIATVSTNPATLLGFGTWAAYGEGRVIVGKAASGTFGTAGATGGAETHTLTTSEIPAHSHSLNQSTYNGGGNQTAVGMNSPTFGSNANTNNAGGGGAHNNLQPYIVAYMWNRTA